jgi:hypothetical protein
MLTTLMKPVTRPHLWHDPHPLDRSTHPRGHLLLIEVGRSPQSIRIGPCSRVQQRELVSYHTPCRREQTYNAVALADPVLSTNDAENIVTSVSMLLYPNLPFHSAVGLFDCYHFFYTHTCAGPVILYPICLVTSASSLLASLRNGLTSFLVTLSTKSSSLRLQHVTKILGK